LQPSPRQCCFVSLADAPIREETAMKKRIFVALFLATALALPLFAQQSDPNSSAQPAASEQTSNRETATGKEPLRQQKPENFWDGDQPSAFRLFFHAFASKGYVRRNMQVVQDRVNELEQLTATNGKMIKDTDGRAQQGIQLASTKVREADQHTLDASNKAQVAHQAASTTNARAATVETVVANLDQYKADHHTVIRFRPGQSVLSKQAKDALDQLAAQLKDQRGYVIEVQGFASGSGQAAIAASRKMADSVERYLVLNHAIPTYRIYVMALGNAAMTGEEGTMGKRPSLNRVEISLLKNDLEQLGSASDATAGQPSQPK
jgi:outer membrane protein OmpA-like peptidoglycan-associated protein